MTQAVSKKRFYGPLVKFYIPLVLCLSGWVAFGVQTIVCKERMAQKDVRLHQLESQIDAMQTASKDLDKTIVSLDGVIQTFRQLQENLKHAKQKIERIGTQEKHIKGSQ
ncbi:MAG: hypothetical protein WDA18_03265 [Candidatus Ratteibacteria bacterium]|jgi:exonuclease VII small subunit